MGTFPGMLNTITETHTEIEQQLDDGDHDRFAHYVRKVDLMKAYVEGDAIIALCGKEWVPSRDPEKFPVCPSCKEIRAAALGE
ncbi:MAG: hypothetical protein ACI9AD_000794 [Nitriliruptoraceae bacterium]|jgi:hypothetical protein